MKSQNIKTLLLTLAFFAFSIHWIVAQATLVSNNSEAIGKIQRTGLKTSMAFSDKKVENAWKDYLKKFGKVTSSKGIYEIEAAKIPSISDKPIRIVSKVEKESDNSAYVFATFDMGTGYITATDNRYSAAEKFMKDFAIQMYRDEYSEKINDAEKLFATSQKNQEKLIEKDADWAKEIQKSQQDIVDMENKIQDRKNKIIDLNRQIEENKTTKLKSLEEVENNRKTVEQMKVKLGEIN